MQVEDLQRRIAIARAAIERNAEPSRRKAVGKTSAFWADFFSLRHVIYPDLNALMVCRREDTLVGSGDNPQGSLEKERAYCARVHHTFKGMVNEGIEKLPESAFGSPLVFEHGGVSRSANFWINAVTTSRTVDFARQFGKKGPLRILEIGPGWGMCVYQLHNVLDVESYTLLDLPENLYVSMLHLGTVLPERSIEFIDVDGEVLNSIKPGSISACLPGAIDRIKAKFDLVLNSFSMQEMDLDSVREYIDWIESVLAPDGIFVSLNSHGKTDLTKPSDYRYEKFHIHHWGVHRRVPGGFFNTIPYEVVVGPRRETTPQYPPEYQDAIGRLMRFGLDAELKEYCDALVAGDIRPTQHDILTGYNDVLTSNSDDERSRKLQALKAKDGSAIWPLIAGSLALARGDKAKAAALLEQSIKQGLSGFALVRARAYLAALNKSKLEPIDGFDPVFAYPDTKQMVETGDLNVAIVHIRRAFGQE